MCRVGSCFNREIELNEKILILTKFLTNNDFFLNFDNKTEFLNKLNAILNRENKISDVPDWILF
jgi:hypothetical protein